MATPIDPRLVSGLNPALAALLGPEAQTMALLSALAQQSSVLAQRRKEKRAEREYRPILAPAARPAEREQDFPPAPRRRQRQEEPAPVAPQLRAFPLQDRGPEPGAIPISDALLDAVRQVESSGNPAAVSPKGARGPYQFLPATGAQYGLAPEDLHDEAKSRTAAGRYLADLQKQVPGGRIDLALAAYNYGPGNLKKIGYDLSRAPAETQNYVRKVLSRVGDFLVPTANAEEQPPAQPAATGIDPEFERLILEQRGSSAAPPATNAPEQPVSGGVDPEFERLFIEQRGAGQQAPSAPAPQARTKRKLPEFFQREIEKKGVPFSIGRAITNIPGDVLNLAGSYVDLVRNPGRAAAGLLNLGTGIAGYALPFTDPELTRTGRETVQAVGRGLLEQYGSPEKIAESLERRPVQSLLDISSALYGGAGLARLARAGARTATRTATQRAGLRPDVQALGQYAPARETALDLSQRAGQTASELERIANLVGPPGLIARTAPAVGRKVGAGASAAGGLVTDIIGNVETGTGARPLKMARQVGKRGTATQRRSFNEAIMDRIEPEDVVDLAKTGIQNIRERAQREYLEKMAPITKDPTILDLAPIEADLKRVSEAMKYSGKFPKSPQAVNVAEIIQEAIDEFKRLPRNQHTAIGFDALKQRIGSIQEKIPAKERSALKVATEAYNSVKSEIQKQAPDYAEAMQAYERPMRTIEELQRALSLGKKASIDTAFRKLESSMRDNVNTNFGYRGKLIDLLEKEGGVSLSPILAGQALKSLTPRGLGRLATGAVGATAAASGALLNPAVLAYLAASSPRLMGRLAYGIGRAERGGRILGKRASKASRRALRESESVQRVLSQIPLDQLPPGLLANILAQTGELSAVVPPNRELER